MRVIGIDPAPGKASTVYDGVFRVFDGACLRHFIKRESRQGDCLICWDAPLTGPANPDRPGGEDGDFTQRDIERFFMGRGGRKAPPGISVRPYCGCPHWTISRAVLGLPRVGPFDAPPDDLPLTPCWGDPPTVPGAYVTEVHPAVALWWWCGGRPDGDWRYKKDASVFLKVRKRFLAANEDLRLPTPQDHDQLDALVAYALGRRWLDGDGRVVLLGDQQAGSFLMPGKGDIERTFGDWRQKNRPEE